MRGIVDTGFKEFDYVMVPTKKGCIENDFDSRLSTPTFKLDEIILQCLYRLLFLDH